MKCEKCGEEMNECTVDDVEQVSCPHCSETCEYDRGWNEALEAVKDNLSLRVLSSYHDGKLSLEILDWSSVEDVLLTLKK